MYHRQFGVANSVIGYTRDGTDTRLLHIGAQFYEVVTGGIQTAMATSEAQTDPRYQALAEPTAYNMTSMERYQYQSLHEEPYGYMPVAGESLVAE